MSAEAQKKDTFPGITVPGCGDWTEEEWERLATAIGATLVPLEEEGK